MHTKNSDHSAIRRVTALGTRSLNPDDLDNLEQISEKLHAAVDKRVSDVDERGFDNPRPRSET